MSKQANEALTTQEVRSKQNERAARADERIESNSERLFNPTRGFHLISAHWNRHLSPADGAPMLDEKRNNGDPSSKAEKR